MEYAVCLESVLSQRRHIASARPQSRLLINLRTQIRPSFIYLRGARRITQYKLWGSMFRLAKKNCWSFPQDGSVVCVFVTWWLLPPQVRHGRKEGGVAG